MSRTGEIVDTSRTGIEMADVKDSTKLPAAKSFSIPVVLAALGVNLLALALPIVILQVYDRIIPNQTTSTLYFLIIGLFTALVIDLTLRLVRSYLSGWAGLRFEHEAATRMVITLLRADQNALDRAPPGEHLDRLSAVEPLKEFYINQGVTLTVDLPFIFLFFGLIYLIGGDIVIIPLMLLAAFGIIASVAGLSLRRAIKNRSDMDDRRFSFVIELLSGVHTVKSMAMESQMLRRYERLQEGTSLASYRASYLSGLSQSLGSIFAQLTTITVVSIGSLLVLGGDLTVGSLAACTMLSGRAVQPLLRAMGIWTNFQNIKIARDRAEATLNMPAERRQTAPRLDAISGNIELRNVTYGYDGQDEPLFEGVSLEINAGETIAIKGGNGDGKSTLLNLILGNLKPTSGEVLLDGQSLTDFDAQSAREQMGYLPQNAALFQGTILENMTMFRNEQFADQAIDMARLLGVDEFVARLPKGLDTPIGESTTETLPGGVKQRIAVIRGLLNNPAIVLFDEANNALDRRSDEMMTNVLERLHGNCTLILVSYRPSLLKLADRTYEIKDRKLVLQETSEFTPVSQTQSEPASRELKERAVG